MLNVIQKLSLLATSLALVSCMPTIIGAGNFSASQLVFQTEPASTGTAGVALTQQPVVRITTSAGVLVSSSASITLSLYADSNCSTTPLATNPAGTASVTGGSATASNGVAAFTSLAITDAVSTLYLQASSSGLTSACSSAINISAASVSASTSSVTAASSSYAVTGAGDFMTVTLKDQYGNVVSGKAVSLAAAPSAGVTMSAASGLSNASGLVTFTANSTAIQSVVFSATDTTDSRAITPTVSVSFVAGAPYKLAYLTQPSSSSFPGTALAQQPVAWVEDSSGNQVLTSSASVTLALYLDSACTLPATATTSGASVSASSGAATFTSFTVTTPGVYYVGATATGLVTACSSNSLGVGWTVEDGAASDNAAGKAIAVDSSGNVYVTGYTDKALDGQTLLGTLDFFITKYNASGTRLWTVEDGASGANAGSAAITVDSSGNVYVAGSTNTAIDGQTLHGGVDLYITKYNSSGTRQWTVEDGATGALTAGYGIALDSLANVYVTGSTTKAIDGQTLLGSQDFFITKYNSSGTRQWTIEDGAATDTAYARGIAVDTSGNVYVTGSTTKAIDGQTLLGSQDFFITKYNSSGTRQWTVEDGAANDTASGYGIAVDALGIAYVTGYTSQAIDGQTLYGSQDFFITKYNTSGTRQWTVEDGAANDAASGYGIAVDASANVYATGATSKAIDGQTLHGVRDIFITKYNTNGTRQWTMEDGTANDTATGNGIAVDASGNAYTTGQTSTAIDGQTFKAINGNPLYGAYDFFIKQN
jgi:hypothetical protein